MQFTFLRGRSKLKVRINIISRTCLIVLPVLAATLSCFVTDARAQRVAKQSGYVTLIVRPQIELQEHGTDVVLKIRLAEGTNVKLWGSDSCEFSKDQGKTFAASGIYTVSLEDLSQGPAYACAVSSDGLLKASILLQK